MALTATAVSALLLTVTLAVVGALVARHQVDAAADLAALAAAGSAPGTLGCAVAARVATLNGARLRSCLELADGSVVVTVSLATSPRRPIGTARAGRLAATEAPIGDT